MACVQDEILEEFYRRLSKAEGFTDARVQQLREIFGGTKKPKPADLIKVFSEKPAEVMP